MELVTLQYTIKTGWSVSQFPDLDSDHTLIIVFAAPGFINHPEPIHDLCQHYSKSHMIGCSSAGEIFGQSILDDSMSVAIIRFEKTTVKITKKQMTDARQSRQVGQAIAKELDNNDLQSILVLSEGLTVNGTELVSGLNQTEKKVVITGGLAGDGDRFQQTWSIYNGEILKNHTVAVGLYGDHIKIGHGSRGGWDIFGPERRVTRSENNILYELDGRPALALYKEYLGTHAANLPAAGLLYPLAIRNDESDNKHLVRTILGINEKEQSLIFAGDIPLGSLAQLMRANFDRLITGANNAGQIAKSVLSNTATSNSPLLSIAISCVGRRLVLKSRTEEEIESVLDALPPNTQQIGFYSYGELSPHSSGTCDLHNQTMTLTLICED